LSEREIVCGDLGLALDDLRGHGFRIDLIYPADDPHTAVLSREGDSVRVTTRPGTPPPSGELPTFEPQFVFTPAEGSSAAGRAGMLYRELIPDRFGGRYIASHISIPGGGPVSDWVHFHHVALQLIVGVKGWVRVVYEDQGEPFVMEAGDLVLQPPAIRHRVLESSPGLEVVEISAPAVHEPLADHDLALPNGRVDPDRLYSGQRFLRHIAREGREIGLGEATAGTAEARMMRLAPGERVDVPSHGGELVFGFVTEGSGRLEFREGFELGRADAFVIPPDQAWTLVAGPQGLGLLHVTTARMG
jgi:quercetin dioxygenase-like cupin family protein